ncbi:TrbI/VirB10 family protein [Morganella morganii]|uniref:TrbI/VirB10 family protein n=1 Tax=Morganella morganii TaxID=582 RepID=UPI001FFD4821|nr:TrbI/VirB10 family protein [Morganella morganii]
MGLFDKKKKNKVTAPDSDNNGAEKKFTEIEGDRGLYNVKGKQGKNSKKLIAGFVVLCAGIVVIALVGSLLLSKKNSKPVEVVPENAEVEQYARNESGTKSLADLKRQQERNEKKSLGDVMSEVNREQQEKNKEDNRASEKQDVIILPPAETETRGDKKVVTPEMRKMQGDILISAKSIAVPVKNEADLNKSLDNRQVTTSENDFLKGASFADGKVGIIRNREFLLSAGTSMPCVLRTKIVTSYPAVVMCQLTKNVYSDDGKSILIRSGALLQGEQTRVMQQGVARVFVNWSTVKDRNIRVRIDALGADGLGASGLPAWVDSHFWERFGGAIMLSFIDDALAAAASHAGKENSSLTVDNTRNTAGNMAELALENSINIPPTAYVNQGEMLTVIVPRNIDFSSVYKTE